MTPGPEYECAGCGTRPKKGDCLPTCPSKGKSDCECCREAMREVAALKKRMEKIEARYRHAEAAA